AVDHELLAAPRLSSLLRIDRCTCALESGPLRSHVGCRQRELRTHDALFGDVAGNRRGHGHHPDGRYADTTTAARTSRRLVDDQEWPVHDGRCIRCAARRGHSLLRRTSERVAASRGTEGVQFEAGELSRWNVWALLLRHVVRDRRRQADGSYGASSRSEPTVCGDAELRNYHGRRRTG